MVGVEELAKRIRWAVAAGLALGCGPTVVLPDDGDGGASQGNDDDDDDADSATSSPDDDDDTPATTVAPTSGDDGTSDDDDDDGDDDDDDGPSFDVGGGTPPDPPMPSDCFDDPPPPPKPGCDGMIGPGQVVGHFCVPKAGDALCDTVSSDDVLDQAQTCLGCGGFADAVACGPEAADGSCCYWVVYSPGQSCPGRPFTIDGRCRVPGVVRRNDWAEAIDLEIDALAPEIREALAAAWADEGCYEAASVGSFARFVLELIGQAAPPSLIADAQRALGEEVGHARTFFGLASAYGRCPVGPSEIDVTGALDGSADAIDIAERLASEGCIAESISALQLQVAASRAEDPQVRARLLAVAEEELRHAELAWRALAWMLRRGDDRMRQSIATVFANATDFVPKATSAADELAADVLHRAGRLTFDERNMLAERALGSIVAPAVDRLFDPWTTSATRADSPRQPII